MNEPQEAMLDMVKEVRRVTKVFEEAHSDLSKAELQSSIMTALLGIFIEYSRQCRMSMKSIRGATEYALDRYEKLA